MELGGTHAPTPEAPQASPQPNTSQKEKAAPPVPNKGAPEQPKKGLFGALGNPKVSKESQAVLQALNDKKAFQIEATKYGKVIAESIMVQSAAVMGKRLNFEDEMKRRIELKGGSYAIIYKGDLPVRISPFIWQLDQATRRMWAVFTFNNFYGHADPSWFKFWKKFWTILVLTPFDSGSKMVETFGKGYWVKFDENTQFQAPINVQDTEEAEKMRVDNKHFISSGLTLWVDLQAATKPKINMRLIMYLVIAIVAIVVIFYFLHSHPGFLSAWLPKI